MTTISDELRRRRRQEIAECFKVIDTCLRCFYNGEMHMYRPLAGQLRMVLCDRSPLLSRVVRDLRLSPLKALHYHPGPTEVGPGAVVHVGSHESPTFETARMPFRIWAFPNGLQVADVETSEDPLIPLATWIDQVLVEYPITVTVRDLIRSVADKGGGAHVDDEVNSVLAALRRTGPKGVGVDVLLIVALARLVQQIGIRYTQVVERHEHWDDAAWSTFDPNHPSARSAAKIPDEVWTGSMEEYSLFVTRPIT